MPPEPYVGSLGLKVSQVHMSGYQVEGGVAQGQPLMSQILIDSQLPPPLGFDISAHLVGNPRATLQLEEGVWYLLLAFFIVFDCMLYYQSTERSMALHCKQEMSTLPLLST